MIKKMICILITSYTMGMVAHEPIEGLLKEDAQMHAVNTAHSEEVYRKLCESIEVYGGRDFDIHLNSYRGDTLRLSELLFLRNCNEDMTQKLAQAGADINHIRRDSWYEYISYSFGGGVYREHVITTTPLHQQITNQNFKAAAKLVELGAGVDLHDGCGNTPIHTVLSAVSLVKIKDIESTYDFLCTVQKDRLYIDILQDIKDQEGRSFMDLLQEKEKWLSKRVEELKETWYNTDLYKEYYQKLVNTQMLLNKVQELPRFVMPELD